MTVKKSRSNADITSTVVKRTETVINTPLEVSGKSPQVTTEAKSATENEREDSAKKKQTRRWYMEGKRVWPD